MKTSAEWKWSHRANLGGEAVDVILFLPIKL